jgi:hypothetical protein
VVTLDDIECNTFNSAAVAVIDGISVSWWVCVASAVVKSIRSIGSVIVSDKSWSVIFL